MKLLIAKDLEPIMEKKIRSELEILIKSKVEEAREEAMKRSKGSSGSVESISDNIIVKFIKKYFTGETEISQVVKETKGGILEVNAEYMESSEDSEGSYGSQISAASRASRRGKDSKEKGRPTMA